MSIQAHVHMNVLLLLLGAHCNEQVAPVYIFADDLGGDAKSVWEAVSHEVGHALGLS